MRYTLRNHNAKLWRKQNETSKPETWSWRHTSCRGHRTKAYGYLITNLRSAWAICWDSLMKANHKVKRAGNIIQGHGACLTWAQSLVPQNKQYSKLITFKRWSEPLEHLPPMEVTFDPPTAGGSGWCCSCRSPWTEKHLEIYTLIMCLFLSF